MCLMVPCRYGVGRYVLHISCFRGGPKRAIDEGCDPKGGCHALPDDLVADCAGEAVIPFMLGYARTDPSSSAFQAPPLQARATGHAPQRRAAVAGAGGS